MRLAGLYLKCATVQCGLKFFNSACSRIGGCTKQSALKGKSESKFKWHLGGSCASVRQLLA